jgi:GAF domain-containing protein
MDPIPETLKAIDEFGPFLDDDDLLKHLLEMGRRVREVVPECVGLSMSFRDHGVTFTLVASDESIAALDGLQYLDGGPCVAAVEEERVVRFPDEDALGEDEWQLFARGTAAASVASTLTLPLVVGDRVTGSVNLYAASPNAFADKEQEIAAIVGGWAPGATANADLSFSTRRAAQEAPRLLFAEMRTQIAVGILVASLGVSVDSARKRLHDAALRAGIDEQTTAKALIDQALDSDDADDADDDAPGRARGDAPGPHPGG